MAFILFVLYTLFVNQLLTQEINAWFLFIASTETLTRTKIHTLPRFEVVGLSKEIALIVGDRRRDFLG